MTHQMIPGRLASFDKRLSGPGASIALFPPKIHAARGYCLCQITCQASDSACFYFASCEDFGVACGRTVLLYSSPPPSPEYHPCGLRSSRKRELSLYFFSYELLLRSLFGGSPSVVLRIVERVNTFKRKKELEPSREGNLGVKGCLCRCRCRRQKLSKNQY